MGEIFVNNPATTLSASCTSSDATISVTSGTGYPGTGNFRIKIEDEWMLVTGVSGATWTVTRGIESTTAASHASGVSVNAIVSAGSLNQGIADGVGSALLTGPYVGFPGLYSPLPTSGWSFPAVSGVAGQQGVSLATVNGALQWTQPLSTGSLFSTYARAQPSTPYKVLIGLDVDLKYVDFFHYGVGFWDGSKVKAIALAYNSGGGGLLVRIVELSSGGFTDVTDVSIGSPLFRIWFQLENDSSTLTFKYGVSPGLLRTLYTQAVGTFITPTHLCLIGSKNNSSGQPDLMGFNAYNVL